MKKKKIDFEKLSFEPITDVLERVQKKIGKRPRVSSSLPKGVWTEQSMKVLSERYLLKDAKGDMIETPEDLCWRVSWEIASAESLWGKDRGEITKSAVEFYKLMVSGDFLPNSPTLMNAGTGNMLQYSACFVLPVEDSMEGIFDALKYQALIHKSGGGTGFSFTRLRPKGAMVRTSNGMASGPISFMRVFDAATNEVKQGGKRRGANMGILRVDHPDILEFIHCKEEGGITNFNISVAITDKFMEAYEGNKSYDLIDPKTKTKVGSLSARQVFDEIADGAWRTGDPGLVFIDRRNRGTSNPVPALGPIEATNPCGEQELYPFDACNLGSIFLGKFILSKNGKKQVDWEKLKKVTKIAVRFLDDVIEVNPYPLEQIRKTVLAIRRIGLGVGGWADMLIDLGIPYDSDEAIALAGKIMKTIQDEAVSASEDLARERGAFPMWSESIYSKGKPRRNSTVTTIAPTGTISIIAGASSGIEPLFAIAYRHIVKDKHLERTLNFVNPKFIEIAKERGFWSEKLESKVSEHGTVRGLAGVPEDIQAVFGTAHEIHHNWHIKMQSEFQKYTENAVSKTINMENKVKVDEVKDAYLLSWKTSCKGITVFRDGCKDLQVLNVGVNKKKEEKVEAISEPTLERPYKVSGATYKMDTPVGTAFITINEDGDGQPLEVFINVGKAGSDVTAVAEALGRTISTALRFRGNLSPKDRAEEIATQLAGIGGRRSVGFGLNRIRSLPDAVAVAISNHFNFKLNGNGKTHINLAETNGHTNGESKLNGHANGVSNNVQSVLENHILPNSENISQLNSIMAESLLEDSTQVKVAGDICPSCGASALVYEEGCSKCHVCGHSEC